uniref:dehydrogenase/reductase SDR family member 4-like n=1 Tax=Styela clava TaxID=7725 RepID=UPI0019398503|nr:dehydrogenase/reductase SDR family member 4-like [Styela clava]
MLQVFKNCVASSLLTTNRRLIAVQSRSMGKLDGKVAVVTASTEGIGLAIAKKLGKDGAHVVISSRKQKNVDKALQELKAENLSVSGMVCHVGNGDHRKALFEKAVSDFGGLDILVSNAAVNPYFGTLITTPEQAFDKIMEINVKAAYLLVKEAAPYIEKRGKGSIVLVSSIGGLVPFSMLGAYSISKTALLGMNKVLSSELAPNNIRVNCIAPGIIKTKFSGALWTSPEQKEIIESTNPMNRLGEPDECAGIVSFLCSEEASFITGETIVIAGGAQSRL